MQILTGFAPLAARYDGFIIDLWGVVHDGVTPYEGAVDCLERLRNAGKRVIMLSNAPRRADAAAASMKAMGIPDGLHAAIVTSGEITHRMLRDREDPWFSSLGRRVFHLGPDRDRNLLDGLGLELTSPQAADFVLNTGPDDTRDPTDIGAFEGDLQACAARRLPMICANPDLEVIRGGRRIICAGALAQRYAELGGDVKSIGKPDPLIYGPILAEFDLPKARVLVVGDSLRTDIAGAHSIGVDACWVLGGIHAGQNDPEAEAAAAGLHPVAAIHSFRW